MKNALTPHSTGPSSCGCGTTHHPLNDVERRTAEGRPKREIIRCLKRFLAREIFQRVMADDRARQAADLAA